MKLKKIDFAQFIFIVVLLFCVVFPLGKMIMTTSPREFFELFTMPKIQVALINSIFVSLVATTISILVAYLLAWSIKRTNIRFKSMFSVLLVIPMLIPSISQGTGLIILFGSNGFITTLFGLQTSIYGFWGIVCGAFLYSYPIAFLMFSNILEFEDGSPYEAAVVLGLSPFRKFLAITIPYLRKPMISVFFAVFTMIFTDYGIPLSIGGKYLTLPGVLYQEVIGQLNFSKGSAIGLILLLPAVLAFVIDLFNKDKGNQSFITRKMELTKSRTSDIIGYISCGLILLLIILVNSSFTLLAVTKKYPNNMSFSLDNFVKTFELSGAEYLVNSVIISIAVTIVGTSVAFGLAYITARIKDRKSKLLHLIVLSTLAIPGIVLGLSYSLSFSKSFIYGTLLILILVNLVHFINSPYLMMYNTMAKINENLEDVGATLGVNRFYMIKDIFFPQVRFTLLEMASYFFTNSMVTISAVTFLATTATKPFSLMINQFEALMTIECSAVVALVILMVNLCVKLIVYIIRRKLVWQ